MAKEIERKFRVITTPDNLQDLPHEHIEQGYIVVASDGVEVRVRRKGAKFFETVKSGEGVVRREIEIEITERQFAALWAATEGRRLEKTRYTVPDGNGVIAVDVYRGRLQGLILAEREFGSEIEASAFRPPDWLGEDVTHKKEYKNQNLALVRP